MKNLLLDTHIALWLLFDSEKISESILNELKNKNNKLYISAVSFWEISIKFQLGKLALGKFSPLDLLEIYESQGFIFLPMVSNETASFYQLDNDFHKDPFDRMLIWQAIKNNFYLVSNDSNILPYCKNGLKLIG